MTPTRAQQLLEGKGGRARHDEIMELARAYLVLDEVNRITHPHVDLEEDAALKVGAIPCLSCGRVLLRYCSNHQPGLPRPTPEVG